MSQPSTSKNPSSFYGEKYLTWGPKDSQGITQPRGVDNGHFYEMAHTLGHLAEALFDDPNKASILDVGCGRGFVLRHLEAIGFKKLQGYEYGPLSEIRPVSSHVAWADLTKRLPTGDKAWDLVACVGVLSHLPEHLVDQAIRELYRVTGAALITHIQTEYRDSSKHHRTFKPAEWWKPRFVKAGYRPLEMGAFLWNRGFRSREQWGQVWSAQASASLSESKSDPS